MIFIIYVHCIKVTIIMNKLALHMPAYYIVLTIKELWWQWRDIDIDIDIDGKHWIFSRLNINKLKVNFFINF